MFTAPWWGIVGETKEEKGKQTRGWVNRCGERTEGKREDKKKKQGEGRWNGGKRHTLKG